MFQKTKQLCRKAFGFVNGIPTKVMMFSFMLLSGMVAKAQNSAGDYSAGTSALSTVADEIAKYVPIMVKLCYAIAGVVAIVGAISVYIAMNNEEQDVKKKIMMVVGACIFLIAAAKALPLGIQGRYIYWAAVTTCGAIVGFVAAYCLLGFIAGLVVLATVVSVGIVLILLKQRKGLHSKKVAPGVYVYAHSRKI